QTTWVCLDCELMPWSAKAQELLRSQYAAVGAAGRAALPQAIGSLERTASRLAGADKGKLDRVRAELSQREENVARFVAAYRQYCWTVSALTDLKLAPFHLLATEGCCHVGKDHVWHMEQLTPICQADPALLLATPYQLVD